MGYKKGIEQIKAIAESLYFALEPKTLKPLFTKTKIIRAIKKKTGVTITLVELNVKIVNSYTQYIKVNVRGISV